LFSGFAIPGRFFLARKKALAYSVVILPFSTNGFSCESRILRVQLLPIWLAGSNGHQG
jgi:hypothetical protein